MKESKNPRPLNGKFSLRQQLQEIKDQVSTHFNHMEKDFSVTSQNRELIDHLATRITQVVTQIRVAATASLPLNEAEQVNLRVDMKKMTSALNSLEYVYTAAYPVWDEDVYRLTMEATGSEHKIPIWDARELFAESYQRIVAVLDELEAATVRNPHQDDPAHPPGGRTKATRAGGERDSNVSARRTELRNMMRSGKQPSALEVCRRWDSQGIRVPSKWSMDAETNTWQKAYAKRKLKNRVQKLISNDMKIIRTN